MKHSDDTFWFILQLPQQRSCYELRIQWSIDFWGFAAEPGMQPLGDLADDLELRNSSTQRHLKCVLYLG